MATFSAIYDNTNYLSYQQDKYYKIWSFLKKIRIFFQNIPKNVISDLYKLCFQNYCASLIKVVMKRKNLNCINHFLV